MNIKKIEIDQETGEVEITFIAKNNNDPELQKFYREKLMGIPVDVIPQPALIPAANIEEENKKTIEPPIVEKKKRGRPKKEEKIKNSTEQPIVEKKKRGRTKKEEKNKSTIEPLIVEKKKRGRPKKEQEIKLNVEETPLVPEQTEVIESVAQENIENNESEVLKNDLIELSEHITIPDNMEKKESKSVKIDVTVPSEERDDMDAEALQIILRKKDSPMYAIKHIKERAGITMDEARIYCNELWRRYQEEMERIKAEERANALQNE